MTTAAVIPDTYKVALAPIQRTKIPPGSPLWKTFNGSFKNLDLPQVAIAEALYEGHPITTWMEPQWRKTANYKLGQHLGMDFDTEDKRSTIAELLREPFIRAHASILYTTPSHTPDKPRARVVFLLDTPIMQAKNYALAASALLWLFGNADRQCKDPARFYFGGRPGACEMEWPGNVLPVELIKDLIKRYQASGRRERKRQNFEPGNADQADIVSALKAIDAWGIPYDEWLAVLMAIHSELPGMDGLQIAEAWADGRPNEVADKWKGFKPSGNEAGRVTIGTLFAMAQRAGWERYQ